MKLFIRNMATMVLGVLMVTVFSISSVYSQSTFENLYLVGDAAPGGWNISNPTPMTPDSENPGVFIYSGFLLSGEFKISTFKGDWCDEEAWLRPPTMHPSLDDTEFIVTMGCPPGEEDFKWKIEELGEYVVTVNLNSSTIVFEYLNGLPYSTIYLVGNAVPGGWNIANPTPMVQDVNVPWVFVYDGFLLPGEFKISTFTGDWCDEKDWIRPPVMHPSKDNTDYIITTGCPPDVEDFKWMIGTEDAGINKIVLNFQEKTLRIGVEEETSDAYEVLYLVGDATPGGWSLDAQTPMTRSTEDPLVFTWSGTLAPGEFKIKTYEENNFCGDDWIHPLVHEQSFDVIEYQILMGCGSHSDPKWVVAPGEGGEYSITVHLGDETIQILSATSADRGELPDSWQLYQNYPNPFNPVTNISFNLPMAEFVTLDVWSVTGQKVASLVNEVRGSGLHSVQFNATNLSSGVYFYRIEAGSFSQTKRLLLLK